MNPLLLKHIGLGLASAGLVAVGLWAFLTDDKEGKKKDENKHGGGGNRSIGDRPNGDGSTDQDLDGSGGVKNGNLRRKPATVGDIGGNQPGNDRSSESVPPAGHSEREGVKDAIDKDDNPSGDSDDRGDLGS